ncbi:WD repeat domain phosphoinositide-interacting protein 2 isoform X4 [Harpegnathos saltator]|uniref:WD repeat domain phosphoinositide-interacting protein 2 isoform X4 n=1 Tax=Harpegnathos saltator TaxID=610380 RepID=UPI000DBED0BA|nr:WD repeat domain phosphoinositide-interacting protein 2 isoform X4 [Harpegnathos saltator]
MTCEIVYEVPASPRSLCSSLSHNLFVFVVAPICLRHSRALPLSPINCVLAQHQPHGGSPLARSCAIRNVRTCVRAKEKHHAACIHTARSSRQSPGLPTRIASSKDSPRTCSLSRSLAVGSKSGYKLFSISSAGHLEKIYENDTEDICIVERLFSSSLVAVVSLSSPRTLTVCHFRKGTEICNYSYSNTILAVKLNRARLVVCLEESLYIHNIRDMRVLHTIRDTPPNLSGLCTLSICSDNCYLAYPGSNTIGEVQIFDAIHLQAKTMIPAHDSPLAALAFSSTGTKVATASEKGTVIRVFDVHEGTKLFEFRRGVKRCVTISSLSFSSDSMWLCCSSNTETVHIFKLEEPKETPGQTTDEAQSWMGYLTKAVTASANYLPSQVTDVFTQGRAFASVHLPFQGLKNVCAITVTHKIPKLLVASADGYLYVYNLDLTETGGCTLLKQHRLDDKQDETDCGGSGSGASAQTVQNTGKSHTHSWYWRFW